MAVPGRRAAGVPDGSKLPTQELSGTAVGASRSTSFFVMNYTCGAGSPADAGCRAAAKLPKK